MMWRLRHYLFGQHFVVLDYAGPMIRRVQWTPTGRPFIRPYSAFVWLDDPSERWDALTFDKKEFMNRVNHVPVLRVVS